MDATELIALANRCIDAANDADGPDHYGPADLRIGARFGAGVLLWEARIGRWRGVSVESPEAALDDLHREIVGGGS